LLSLPLLVRAGGSAGVVGEPALISFYACQRCAAPPVLDGKLGDACWQALPAMEDFYQYWSPTPKPAPLRTSARLCYDRAGLYLGIRLFEENLGKVKATITNRDNPVTWMDDCVEIMVDPQNCGTGYLKFVTNLNGARYDERCVNTSLDASWNVEGWKVATATGEGEWVIECFLPWTDLAATPADGDIWSFDLVRYGYSTGQFRGVTWSLGGSGAAPQKLGYLGFGVAAPCPSDGILAALARVAEPVKGARLRLLLPGLVLERDAGGTEWGRSDLGDWLKWGATETTAAVSAAEAATSTIPKAEAKTKLAARVAELRAKLAVLEAQSQAPEARLPAAACLLRQSLRALRKDAEELKWDGMLLALALSE
jgi:hypothetical protein